MVYFHFYDITNPASVKRKITLPFRAGEHTGVGIFQFFNGSRRKLLSGDRHTGGTAHGESDRFLRPCGPVRNDSVFLYTLLLTEGLAVGALVHGGVRLMGTYQNPIQGAEVCVLAMMGALLNGALNALVCMAIHSLYPPFLMMELDCPHAQKTYISFMLAIDFFYEIQYNVIGICEVSQICIMKGGNPVFEKKGILP